MKSYFALTCGVLFVGALCAVLALPASDPSAEDDSASGSKEEPLLSFPEYSLNPPNLLKAWTLLSSVDSSSSDSSSSDSSGDSSSSDSISDESGSEQPQGRTIFLLLRLLYLLAQSNSTLLG